MGYDSQILPLVVGAIKTNEEFATIQVNCFPESKATAGRPDCEVEKIETLFPAGAGTLKVVPLIGGSIVKITFKNADATGEKSIHEQVKNAKDLTGKYDRQTNRLKRYIESNTPKTPSLSDLNDARVRINKALLAMPSLSAEWHAFGVPSFILSSYMSGDGSVKDAATLQKKIDAEDQEGINPRFYGLKIIGNFKFIPIDTIKKILGSVCAEDETEYGLENYVGYSGETFGTLYGNLGGKKSLADLEENADEYITKAILELFPIRRLDDDAIVGRELAEDIGFFTAYGDSIYVKMPDMSGRDSSGFSQNMYNLSQEDDADEEVLTLTFEFLKDHLYSAKAFEYKAPPCPEMIENDLNYPPKGRTTPEEQIIISKDGLETGTYRYYLSPIFTPKGKVKASGFRESDEGIEVFTAPVLTKTYFEPSSDTKESPTPVPASTLSTIYEDFVDYMQDQKIDSSNQGLFNTSVLDGMSSSATTLTAGSALNIVDLGVPLQTSLSDIGVDKTEDILGEINRPEILIGYRDGLAADEKNNEKFFEPKTAGSKNIVSSVMPNILTDEDAQIPSLWIELKAATPSDSDLSESNIALELKTVGALEIFNGSATTEYALYVVDVVGQIVRVPGENVTIYPPVAQVTGITPNGFRAANTVFEAGETVTLRLSGTAMGEVSSVNVYSDLNGQDLITSFQDGDEINGNSVYFTSQSDTALTIQTFGTWDDFVGSNVGTFYLALQSATGFVGAPKALYVASPGTLGPDLPKEVSTPVKPKDPFHLKVPKFKDGLHSIPLLMDGQSAEIKMKSKEKIFEDGGKLYAYIAVANTAANKDILDDFCFTDSADECKEVSVGVSSGLNQTLLVPTILEYEFNGSDFYSKNKRKAILKFPGTAGAGYNLSRFTELEAESGKSTSPAFLLIANASLTGEIKGGVTEGSKNYVIIPLGGAARSGTGPAFISPPQVLGSIAELPAARGENRIASSIDTAGITDGVKDALRPRIKRHLVEGKSDGDKLVKIVAADALTRLAVVFTGPDEPRLSARYKVYIGTKKLKKYRAGRIKYAGDNNVVANFRNITGITDEGWTDVTVLKKDKRFNVTYDSTVYNITTIKFDETDLTQNAKGETTGTHPLTTSEGTKVLDIGGDKQIAKITKGEEGSDDTLYAPSVIFPGGNSHLSPFPLLSQSSHPNLPGEAAVDDGGSNAYYTFGSPIKVIPSVTLKLGAKVQTSTSEKTRGVVVSDFQIDDDGKLKEDILTISTSGNVEIEFSLDELVAAGESLVAEVTSVASNVQSTIDDAAAAAAEAGEELGEAAQELQDSIDGFSEQESEFNSVAAESQDAVTADEAAAEAMEQARSDEVASGDGAIGSGLADAAAAADAALGALNDAGDAVEDAVGALADLANSILALTDKLSSIVQSIGEAIEDAASAFASRPSDFAKANILHTYIPDGAVVSSGAVRDHPTDGTLEWKMFLKTTYYQTAAIKFNVPEIIDVTKGDARYTQDGDNKYASLEITQGDTLTIRTIGTTLDTKFEVGGKRVKGKYSPTSTGIYLDFDIKIPDLSSFSIFGTNPCIKISISNTNENRLRLGRTVGGNLPVDLDPDWIKQMFGGNRSKTGPAGDLKAKIEKFFLKFTAVKLDKANIAKELMQSFCDFSFHLTAELSLQLRNLKVLLIPIKIIFCIIDVICALLHPIRLAFAIIRLFLCLYDLICLLPQLSVPCMMLALLLHILELLLCVIIKILSIINAINEIATALELAIENKNYPSIMALEEAINEHLFSLEADLEVLEPILTILALFLELLQLLFAFPCQVGADDDEEACIDSSMLAGLILSKVAPNGRIEPDALIPLAQTYTTIPLENIGVKGNTPPDNADPDKIEEDEAFMAGNYMGNTDASNFFIHPYEVAGTSKGIVASEVPGGTDLPGLKDSATGENKQTEAGGFFSSAGTYYDLEQIHNVDYSHLRFNGPDRHANEVEYEQDGETITINGLNNFQATFGLSFTKSKKEFKIWTGPDPRIVSFEFKGRGETHALAFGFWLIAIFFRKKNIDMLQTCDSMPSFLTVGAGDLKISTTDIDKEEIDFVSPIDGAGGDVSNNVRTFIEYSGVDGDFTTFTPLPLTVDIDLMEPSNDNESYDVEFIPRTVKKTFGGIPMVALIDHDFNVYFIEDDGIKAIKEDGVWKIASISAKMINKPSAPKQKLSREAREVFEFYLGDFYDFTGTSGISQGDLDDYPDGELGETVVAETHSGAEYNADDTIDYTTVEPDGSILVKMQANANAIGDKAGKLADPVTVDSGEDCDTGESVVSEGYNPDSKDEGLASDKPAGDAISWSTIKNHLTDGSPFSVSWINEDTTCGEIIPWPSTAKSEMSYTFTGEEGEPLTIDDIPFPGYGAKDFAYGTKSDQKALNAALDSIRVFDFPRLYMIDMRQVADDIASACGASGPLELLMDLIDSDRDFAAEVVSPVEDCFTDFLNFFKSEAIIDPITEEPEGFIPKSRFYLAQGKIPPKCPIQERDIDPDGPFKVSIKQKYDDLVDCVNTAIDDCCEFVINPLNTTFMLSGDEDETPLPEFVNPEQADLAQLADIAATDDDLSGLPQITGAMEYASGIGDMIILEAEEKAYITIIPREADDSEISGALDLVEREKIKIDFVEDETETGAELVPVVDGTEELVVKEDNTYTLAVSSETPGKVVIRGSICGVVIQAVTDRGIQSVTEDLAEVDCIPEVGETSEGEEVFAPGALMKVDRLLTIFFTAKKSAGSKLGDPDRDESARSAKPGPQTFGTKLEN